MIALSTYPCCAETIARSLRHTIRRCCYDTNFQSQPLQRRTECASGAVPSQFLRMPNWAAPGVELSWRRERFAEFEPGASSLEEYNSRRRAHQTEIPLLVIVIDDYVVSCTKPRELLIGSRYHRHRGSIRGVFVIWCTASVYLRRCQCFAMSFEPASTKSTNTDEPHAIKPRLSHLQITLHH